MTFKEFRASDLFNQSGWFAITFDVEEGHYSCTVVQWEPYNQKWYAQSPFNGRQEIGYVDIYANFHKIVHIRSVSLPELS